MNTQKKSNLQLNIPHIYQIANQTRSVERCIVAPSPELREEIKKEIKKDISRLSRSDKASVLRYMIKARDAVPPGMNDGLIYPGDAYPLGTPVHVVRRAAADRAPLSGVVRVVVVLVQFNDRAMIQTNGHFDDLFFSIGVLPNGSVREYFNEVSHGIIDIQGQIVGPYTMPQTLAQYANNASGIGSVAPNARTMARDAAQAANPDVNFAQYDNDSDGYVDAFIVIHAGPGAEQTGNSNDIWSHKWVLSGGAYNADGTNIYAYLTVPEDAHIGVCCHELGHLLFGFPDLYDTDYSSEGVGNWCLMGGGSWNGGGDIPAHLCAWCKANQGWITVQNQSSNISNVNIADVKSSNIVYRLWKDGTSGAEYFLVENRQKTGYDQGLPGQGLLIWHIDETIASNTDENHPKVALVQADGNRNLENGDNRGDAGDPYPGSSNNTNFNDSTTPNSKSYGNVKTCVAVNNISASSPIMTADLQVSCAVKIKEGKDIYKEQLKERKDYFKEIKERIKDYKEIRKDKLEIEAKEFVDKRLEKPEIDKRVGYDKGFADKPTDKYVDKPGEAAAEYPSQEIEAANLEARVSFLEESLAAIEPFIDTSLRPDLRRSALVNEEDLSKIGTQMQKNAADAKRSYDTNPQEVRK